MRRVFDGQESVRWLIEHPLPLFLCVIDKASLLLRVYHTSPRFYVWTLPPLPSRVELIPGNGHTGRPIEWAEGNRFSLSAPIIEATIADLHNQAIHSQVAETLRFWIDREQENLARIRTGIYEFRTPDSYSTNSTHHPGWVTRRLRRSEDLATSTKHLAIVLSWLTEQLHVRGDIAGAARGAVLLRHLFPDAGSSDDPDHSAATVHLVQSALNERLSKNDYVFAGVDALGALLDAHLRVDTPAG